MALIGYARVSSSDQNLTVQRQQLTEAGCERIFEEMESGTTVQNREQFKACLAYLREGDTLMVTRADRFARSLLDFAFIVKRLSDANIDLKCLLQPELNIDTITGKLIAHILFAFAEYETELRKQRQREGIERAKADGTYHRAISSYSSRLSTASRFLHEGYSYAEAARRSGINERNLRRRIPGFTYAEKAERRASSLSPNEPSGQKHSRPPSAGKPVKGQTKGGQRPGKGLFLDMVFGRDS